jgi:hypothetical protein
MKVPVVSDRELAAEFDDHGYAELRGVLNSEECSDLFAMFNRDQSFRSTVNMSEHRFGEGTYRYFSYPLPPLVEGLRATLYRLLVTLANTWNDRLGIKARYPGNLSQFLAKCHNSDQTRPTPLLLYYERGGANAFHQDNYGSIAFPLQVVILLSRPNVDFAGGSFLLREERDSGSDASVIEVSPKQGDAIIFPNRWRPLSTERPGERVLVKHGVAEVSAGRRMTLGVIFHDARGRQRKQLSQTGRRVRGQT